MEKQISFKPIGVLLLTIVTLAIMFAITTGKHDYIDNSLNYGIPFTFLVSGSSDVACPQAVECLDNGFYPRYFILDAIMIFSFWTLLLFLLPKIRKNESHTSLKFEKVYIASNEIEASALQAYLANENIESKKVSSKFSYVPWFMAHIVTSSYRQDIFIKKGDVSRARPLLEKWEWEPVDPFGK